MEVVNLSGAGLVDEEAPALAEQLSKFPALKHLDVSDNPGLDFGSLSLIFEALSGKTLFFFVQTRSGASTFFYCFPRSGRVC